MEYTIIERHVLTRLIIEVNQYITEGWAPLGGVAAIQTASTSERLYYQAMFRQPRSEQ